MTELPAGNGDPWTYGRVLRWTNEFLARRRLPEPRLAAEILLAYAAGCKRIELYTRFDRALDEQILAQFRLLIRRAAGHEPIAYLVGHREFLSLSFLVTPDVLIPRPETEELVEHAIGWLVRQRFDLPNILDLGTGSGCIAVSLLKNVSGARVAGSDWCPKALAVAMENARRHGVHERFTAVQADRLALPPESVPAGGFDLIVSNPPYVAASEVASLDPWIRDYEPKAALTDGEDGLSFYRMIEAEAPGLLSEGASVIVEVGAGRAERVIELLTESGKFDHESTVRDRIGGHERVVQFHRR